MIGLDTNILVRYLTQDDPVQARLANRLIEETLSAEKQGFISTVVLVELAWVLESGYGCGRREVSSVLERVLRTKSFIVEHADVAWQATRSFTTGKGDFADCMIERASNANGCELTFTLDRLAAKSAGMRLLETHHP